MIQSIVILASLTSLYGQLISVPFQAVDRDQMKAASVSGLVNVPLANVDLAYLIDIEIGTPPQPFTLLLDTGSSITWVPITGCDHYCGYPHHSFTPSASATFNTSRAPFTIRYGEGFSRGYYAQDTVSIQGATVPHVNFALSESNDGELTLDGADGILGIGPDKLSVYNNPEKKVIPTLVTVMQQKGVIDHSIFSVYFHPLAKKQKRINGEIVFGGVDTKHIVGEVKYAPLTTKKEYLDYWAVDVSSIKIGHVEKIYKKPLSAMVDTGSTLIYLPREIIDLVFKHVKTVRRDAAGQYIVPCHGSKLPDIVLYMNQHTFVISPQHYVITAGTLTYSKDFCYTYIQDSPPFVDAILGYGFLQQYVSVYDNENKRIGFAERASQ